MFEQVSLSNSVWQSKIGLLGLYVDIRQKNLNIHEVTMDKNHVAPYYVNPRSKQDINSM